MDTPPPSPALRLAEAIAQLIAAICGGGWSLWRFFPGARALRAQLQQFARDFTALMTRIDAGLPTPEPRPAAPASRVAPRPISTAPRLHRVIARPRAAAAKPAATRPVPPRRLPARPVLSASWHLILKIEPRPRVSLPPFFKNLPPSRRRCTPILLRFSN